MNGENATQSADVVLEARGVGRTFLGTESPIVGLEDVNLAIRRAEVVGYRGMVISDHCDFSNVELLLKSLKA